MEHPQEVIDLFNQINLQLKNEPEWQVEDELWLALRRKCPEYEEIRCRFGAQNIIRLAKQYENNQGKAGTGIPQ